MPSGYQPDEMAADGANHLVYSQGTPISCGQWPHDTAKLAVLPKPTESFRLSACTHCAGKARWQINSSAQPFLSYFAGAFAFIITRPSFSGVVRPVEILHQSTPNVRASATSACFFCAGLRRGPKRSRHFFTPR